MSRNIFNSVKLTRPKTSSFDLSHDVKLSCNVGELIPVCAIDTLPGDMFKIGTESLIRFSPLVSPVMHYFDVSVHYFFVPNRILYEDWEAFITGVGQNPTTPPYVTINSTNWNRLADFMGIPKPITSGVDEDINLLPFLAYQKIFEDYYADTRLQPTSNLPVGVQGGDHTGDWGTKWGVIRNRNWEHDYFTSALPQPQAGTGVSLPLSGLDDAAVTMNQTVGWGSGVIVDNVGVGADFGMTTTPQVGTSSGTDLIAKTSALQMSSTSIEELRRAYRLQEWLERTNLGGGRLEEVVLAHFGIKSQDARLQRPEYITGVKTPVVISEVLNTSDTTNAPQGNMAGHAIAFQSGNYGGFRCMEHGWIIGIMSIRPKPAYFQGIPKKFLKMDPMEYGWPTFAHLGEQAIENRELYAFDSAAPNDPTDTFGYAPRYSEYKYELNRVAGDFRDSLNHWHAARIFANQPQLNEAFIKIPTDAADRIFAVTDPTEDKIYCHIFNKIYTRRPLPFYGTPRT